VASNQQLLYLSEGNEASACLEVLRRIAQPASRSLPHITLRHSQKPLRESAKSLYGELHVSDLVLDQITSFDVTHVGHGLRTVVVLCDSEQLEHVSYRPDYPQSVFHITLYDGPESIFAEKLLNELRDYSWGLRLDVDLERHQSSAAAGEASSLSWRHEGWFTDLASSVYLETVALLELRTDLTSHSDHDRIRLLRAVCARLHESPATSFNPTTASRDFLRMEAFSELGQLAFWSEQDISELSPNRANGSAKSIKQNSTFITPPELSLDVVDEALRWVADGDLVDFGDPAIGAGIFYAALRHRIGEERINSARGVEIDVHSARRTLHRWRRSRLSVLVGDFLEQVPEPKTWNLVVANPPYKRSQLTGRELVDIRRRLERELDIRISRRSDLYLYFILRTHAWMNEDAIAAWVIPAEFQVTSYGQSLRTYLSTRVELLRLHTYDPGDSQFDNALISTAVVIFRNRRPSTIGVATVSQGGSLAQPLETRHETLGDLAALPRWSLVSLKSRDFTSPDDRRLGDYFEVKRGVATGANSLFVLSDEQIMANEVPAEMVKPLFPRAKEILGGVLGSDEEGCPKPASGLWLVDTSLSMGEISKRSPKFGEYLSSIRTQAESSALARRRSPFYSQDIRAVPQLAFVYMAKASVTSRRRFILNKSQAVVLNNYLGIHPKPFLRDQIERDPSLLDKVHQSLIEISSEALAAEGRMYGHGLLKLEPSDLVRVVLPDSTVWSAIDAQQLRRPSST
jgi:adenine-specific DNA-methyltransferase